MNKFIKFLVPIAALFSCISFAANTTLSVGHGSPVTSPHHEAWKFFKEKVEKESNGEIKVTIFPATQMGEERELLELVQMGTLDMVGSNVAVLGGWDKAFSASELPYVFPNREVALNVLNGDYGQFLFTRLDDLGITGLGWFENGFRHITNSRRPIYEPSDLQGLKVRTMQVDSHMAAFKKLGANPTPMVFGEVYSAIQQKVVDGQENPFSLIVGNKFYEVAPYISLTNHVYSTHIVGINPVKYNSLPQEYQQLIQSAVLEAEVHQQEVIAQEEKEYINFLESQGAKVNYLTREQNQMFIDSISEIEDDLKQMVGVDAYNVLMKNVEKEMNKS
ncbi:TRAP transporter substrate-binding protein [Photobacterium sp. DNB23_23_1]